MGAKDTKSKEYLSDNSRFADLFNFKLYDGEQIIHPEDLQECDSTELLSVLGVNKKEMQVQKWRDLLKRTVIKSTKQAFYVLLGVENQSEIHYAMPVRTMLYDSLNYGKQISETSKMHKKNKAKMSSTEFLSGFLKTDKLTPIIPLTLYWGVDEWDAPTHLHEMFSEIDENLLQFIPDYYINLVAPDLIDNFTKFKTELGQVLEFIKYSNDDAALERITSSNDKYKKLTNESVSTINIFTGSNLELNEEEGVTDMCLAIENMKQKASVKATAKELVQSVENIMKNLSFSLEDACEALGHSINEYEHAKKILET